jgi:hypothetical protein
MYPHGEHDYEVNGKLYGTSFVDITCIYIALCIS